MDAGGGGGCDRIVFGFVLGEKIGGRRWRSSSILEVMVSCCWVRRTRASSSLSAEVGVESAMTMKAPNMLGAGEQADFETQLPPENAEKRGK